MKTVNDKSLSSLQEPYKTSYSYEIKELREKVAYWKRVSEMHFLEGYYILGELYAEYMKKAQKELEELLETEKKEEEKKANKTPKLFFLQKVSCSFYKPVLPALEKEETEETEDFMGEEKNELYIPIPSHDPERLFS